MGTRPPSLPVVLPRYDTKCAYCGRVYRYGTEVPKSCTGCGSHNYIVTKR